MTRRDYPYLFTGILIGLALCAAALAIGAHARKNSTVNACVQYVPVYTAKP